MGREREWGVRERGREGGRGEEREWGRERLGEIGGRERGREWGRERCGEGWRVRGKGGSIIIRTVFLLYD